MPSTANKATTSLARTQAEAFDSRFSSTVPVARLTGA